MKKQIKVDIKVYRVVLPDGREKEFTVTIKDGYVMFYSGEGELMNFHCDYTGNVEEVDLGYCYLNGLLWNIRQRMDDDVEAVEEYMSIQQKYSNH